MLEFARPDLVSFTAYQPHPDDEVVPKTPLDRLNANENAYSIPDDLKAGLAQIYRDTIETNRYPDGSHNVLKASIAAYVCESAHLPSSYLSPNWISVGNGSDELIRSLLIATCLGNRGSILIAQPTFSMYGILAKTLGIHVIEIDRHPETFAVDLEAADRAIAERPGGDRSHGNRPPIRVVWMVHPNSPTGNALTTAEVDWLRCLPADILVAIDEAYFEFHQHTLVGDLATRPNWVVLRTFSKAFRLAAHRIGYAIAQPETIDLLEKVRLPYNLPVMSQVAALAVLEHRQTLLASVPECLTERSQLLAALEKLPGIKVWNSQGNFLYLRLTETQGRERPVTGVDSPVTRPAIVRLHQTLKAQGTLVRYTGGGLRITVGSPEENKRTLKNLKAWLEDPET